MPPSIVPPYVCPEEGCGKTIQSAEGIRKHKLGHQENVYKCPFNRCPYRSGDETRLQKHIERSHTNPEVFTCPLCEWKAVAPGALKGHLRKAHQSDPSEFEPFEMSPEPNSRAEPEAEVQSPSPVEEASAHLPQEVKPEEQRILADPPATTRPDLEFWETIPFIPSGVSRQSAYFLPGYGMTLEYEEPMGFGQILMGIATGQMTAEADMSRAELTRLLWVPVRPR